ncbi:DUF7661 family protein [Paraburkholderia caribensis]|uniref:DUF7661 family protein n=1 Tax=Paraburkholderia caribensis TaxID=75105 RepID=UPI0007A0C05E|nr:hypothetical protein [Paraburkholderia caribensis]
MTDANRITRFEDNLGRDEEYRFDVFRRIIGVAFKNDAWVAHHIGQDGKRRRADFEIPSFVTAGELLQYLDDLFHEDTSRARLCVVKLFGEED